MGDWYWIWGCITNWLFASNKKDKSIFWKLWKQQGILFFILYYSFEDDIIEKIDISRAIEECDFSEREKGILNLKYGFNSEIINTIVEIAKRYNVTDERIRQIDRKSLEKIKERLETACSSEYKQKSLKK